MAGSFGLVFCRWEVEISSGGSEIRKNNSLGFVKKVRSKKIDQKTCKKFKIIENVCNLGQSSQNHDQRPIFLKTEFLTRRILQVSGKVKIDLRLDVNGNTVQIGQNCM